MKIILLYLMFFTKDTLLFKKKSLMFFLFNELDKNGKCWVKLKKSSKANIIKSFWNIAKEYVHTILCG